MSGVNKVFIIGRLGADPELRQTSNGNNVCTMNLATSEIWKDANGEKQERTEWHRVVVWGRAAENSAKYLAKGRQAFVEGRLQTRSWEGQDGQKKYTTEVIAQNVQFLGSTGASTGDSKSNGDFQAEPYFDATEEVPF